MTPFTVVIPTRERCETLYHTIRTCLSQDYEHFEVLVSDNVSRDGTREVVASFSDSRLKYVVAPSRLSMASHFNFALSHVISGWLVSIGDDDALLPGALRFADSVIRQHDQRPLAASSVYYGWPELPNKILANRLRFSGFGDGVSVRDSRKVVRARIGFRQRQEGYVWGLPGVYRGFIPVRSVQAATRNGRYINSVTPDAYSAFVTAMQFPDYVHVERPLFVEGVSARSNGAAQSFLSGNAEEQRFLDENDIPLNAATVYSPAPSFVMIEAFLQVKEVLPDLVGELSPDLVAMCRSARYETLPEKMPAVIQAIEALRNRYGFPEKSLAPRLTELLAVRMAAAKSAWKGLEVNGDVLGIRNVHDAALVASTLWNHKRGIGTKEGSELIVERMGRLVRRLIRKGRR